MSLISFHECFGCCDFQSADCAINITDHKLPSNFVNGHVLTVVHGPHSQTADLQEWAQPVWKRFSRGHLQ